MGETVLKLKTVVDKDRPAVEIDGGRYLLSVSEDFGLEATAEMNRDAKAMESLRGKEEFIGDDLKILSDLIDSLVKRVVRDLPDDVFKRLSDSHKLSLVQAFTLEAAKRRARLLAELEKPKGKDS